MADDAGDGDDEREWRFSVDEVGEDTGDVGEDTGDVDEADTLDDEDGNGGVTIGDEDDGPTVTFAGPGQAAEEMADGVENGDEESGNVAGTVTPEVPVETDTPDLESALFVAAGALLVLLVFASIVTPLTPRTIGGMTLGVAVVTAIIYAVFVRV